jgi:hypothetical protein
MIIGNSLKQILRTPVTTALFAALFAIAAFFVSAGAVIWVRNQAVIRDHEDTFVTVGTVRQRANTMKLTDRWDAFTKQYTQRIEASYASIVPLSVLEFEGAGYILGPEKRPYYGAYRPDLRLWPEDMRYRLMTFYAVEFTPLEDALPDHPVTVRIKRVLGDIPDKAGSKISQGDEILFCDHFNDDPQPLYAGKTYLANIRAKGPHSNGLGNEIEYYPQDAVFSSQYRSEGAPVEAAVILPAVSEVTEGVYETESGRMWLDYARVMYQSYGTIPVLPTNGTQLLPPFYSGAAYITEGEDITPDEYESGARVCLISENFARNNGILPGAALRLPLYFADYANAPTDRFAEVDYTAPMGGLFEWDIGAFLNAQGKSYDVFSDREYTVKGLYANTPGNNNNAARHMGANTVVIPALSVTDSDADNILAFGPMKNTTTAFQIPNGSIESYMEKWLSLGNEKLEFVFQDRGYSQMKRGLDNMNRLSALFLVTGSAMSLTLAFFFCHVFIAQNKSRSAIERMLGYTKKQCAASLLSGFLLTAALSMAIGCALGACAEGMITESITSREYYDTSFTVGPLGREGVNFRDSDVSPLYAPGTGLVLWLVTGLISAAFTRGSVKEEPLKLLGGKYQ